MCQISQYQYVCESLNLADNSLIELVRVIQEIMKQWEDNLRAQRTKTALGDTQK